MRCFISRLFYTFIRVDFDLIFESPLGKLERCGKFLNFLSDYSSIIIY